MDPKKKIHTNPALNSVPSLSQLPSAKPWFCKLYSWILSYFNWNKNRLNKKMTNLSKIIWILENFPAIFKKLIIKWNLTEKVFENFEMSIDFYKWKAAWQIICNFRKIKIIIGQTWVIIARSLKFITIPLQIAILKELLDTQQILQISRTHLK